jgi:hypothetical protein
MNPVRILGVLILLAGAALLPIGWFYARWILAVAIIASSVALILLMAARDREIEDAASNPSSEKQGAQIDLGVKEN